MLADNQTPTCLGTLAAGIYLTSASRYSLLDFIADELPHWRDDPERPQESSETTLTEHLCDYLNTVARNSNGWDFLQFRTEVVDEEERARHIDLSPKPCGKIVWIEGKRHNHYDLLFPIECKRLPTPDSSSKRREREYVVSESGSTGGIQRFKIAAHGSQHNLAAMIAYVQDGTPLHAWGERVSGWVTELTLSGTANWSADDCLVLQSDDLARGLARLQSRHRRTNLPDIELQHLWVVMVMAPPPSVTGSDSCVPDASVDKTTSLGGSTPRPAQTPEEAGHGKPGQ